jgi:predicted nucleic acid-binding protein
MPATMRQFDDPLPGIIYLDTSLLMRGLESPPKEAAPQALLFLERLNAAAHVGQVTLLISDLVVNELCFQVIKQKLGPQVGPLQQRLGITEKRWLRIHRQYPEVLEECREDIERLYEFLLGYPVFVLSPRDFEQATEPEPPYLAVRPIIERFHLLPTDAFHVVYSRLAGADAIAAVDPDFARVDDLTVYAPASLSC